VGAVQMWSQRNSYSRDGSQTNRERGAAANVTSSGVYGEVSHAGVLGARSCG
jgi:hypothetical protein